VRCGCLLVSVIFWSCCVVVIRLFYGGCYGVLGNFVAKLPIFTLFKKSMNGFLIQSSAQNWNTKYMSTYYHEHHFPIIKSDVNIVQIL